MLLKIFKFVPIFKWVAAITFLIGFLSLFIQNLHTIAKILLIPVFMVGIFFGFIGMISHMLVGFKIKNLSKKYDIEDIYIKKIIQEIYEN
jgi:hypothetical protein